MNEAWFLDPLWSPHKKFTVTSSGPEPKLSKPVFTPMGDA